MLEERDREGTTDGVRAAGGWRRAVIISLRTAARSELIDQPLAHRMDFWRRTGCDPKADVFSGR
jgi:hypothetical protein